MSNNAVLFHAFRVTLYISPIIRLLLLDNSGLLPDEAEREAAAILYRKEVYEQGKWNINLKNFHE